MSLSVSSGSLAPATALFARGELRRYETLRNTGATILLAASSILAVVCFAYSRALAELMGLSGADLDAGAQFLRISAFGIPPLFLFNFYSKALAVEKKNTRVSKAKTAGMVLNFILDPLLIFGLWNLPGFGAGGAAAATVITKVTSLLIAASALEGRAWRPRDFAPEALRAIMGQGLPLTLSAMARPLFGAFLLALISRASSAPELMAFNVSGGIFNIVFIFISAIDIVFTTEFARSNASGASTSRLVRDASLLTVGLVGGFALLCIAFRSPLAAAFQGASDPSNHATHAILVRGVGILALIPTTISQSILKATSRSHAVLCSSIASMGLLSLILLALSPRMSVTDLWWCATFALFIEALFSSAMLFECRAIRSLWNSSARLINAAGKRLQSARTMD